MCTLSVAKSVITVVVKTLSLKNRIMVDVIFPQDYAKY